MADEFIDLKEQTRSDFSFIEQKYKTLFNKMNDSVFVCYINYGKTLSNFIEVNDVACKRLGYSREELLGMSPLSIIFGNIEGTVANVIDKLFEEGSVIFDVVHVAKSGERIRSEVSSHIFDYNEKPAILAISRDISARQKIEEKLKQRTDQLRNLASRLQLVREEERTTLSRELHDELGQSLTVLKIQVSLLSNKLKDKRDEVQEKFEKILELIDITAEAVHRIAAKLRPGILDELGLVPAIEWQCQEFSKSTGIACDIDLAVEEELLDKNKVTAVFRIFQEALTNITRHANAGRVHVSFREMPGKLLLDIADNGKGITLNQINDPHSLGLLGMRERALIFSGVVEIKSSMNRGTTVQVTIPIDK